VPQLKQASILFIETQAVLLLVNRFNATVQGFVELNRIKFTRQHRVDLRFQRPELVIRIRARNVAECTGHLIKQLARRFQRYDGVPKRRCLGVVRNGIDFRT